MAPSDEELRAKNAARQREWRAANLERAREIERRSARKSYREQHGLEGPGKERVVQTIQERAEKKREGSRLAFQKARAELIAAYGGQCSRCGFADARALQLDHINGGGGMHRAAIGRGIPQIRMFIEQRNSGLYQLLCANCHAIKTAEVPLRHPRKPDEELYVNRRNRKKVE